jgi:hypothetical protein
MKQLQTVAPSKIHQTWEIVKPFFEASFEQSTGDCTVEQLKTILAEGQQTLFVVVNEDKVVGAFSVAIQNAPNHRVAHTTAMGGKGLFDENTVSQYETWAKLQGATKIRAWAREPQARLYRQKMNLNTTVYVVEKLI